MKPKIYCYYFGASFLSVKKWTCYRHCLFYYNMYSKKSRISKKDFCESPNVHRNLTEVQAKDLALYTHWPVHTKEFWDPLNDT
jgi:hypothetical protein